MSKRLLDQIIQTRAKGNEALANCVRTKLILKGLNPDKFNLQSPDDMAVLDRIRAVGVELGVWK